MDQLFDHFADLGKLETERSAIMAMFKQLKAGVLELNTLGINLDSTKTVKDMAAAATKIEQAQAKIVAAQAVADTKLAAAREKNAKANAAEQVAEKKTTEVLTAKTKASEAELRLQERREAASKKLAAAQNGERKLADDLTNEYKIFAKAVQEAELRALNLATSFGKSHPVAIQAADDAKALRTQLNGYKDSIKPAAEASGGFFGGLSKGYGIIRQLAAALPALGISTIFLYMFEGISKVIGALDLFSSKLNTTKETKKDLDAAFKDSSVQEAAKNVQELTVNVGLAAKGLIDKKSVVEQYNDTIGKTTGTVKTFDEVERMLIANGEAYIKMTLYKAAANLALEEAAKKSLAAENLRLKNLSDFANAVRDTKISTGGAGGFGTGSFNAKEDEANNKRIIEARQKKKDALIKIETDSEKQQYDIAKNFQDKAAAEFGKLKKVNGGSFTGNYKEDKAAEKEKEKQVEKDRKDALELFKYRMQIAIDEQKAFANLEGATVAQRVKARRKQAELEIQLIKGVAEYDLKEAKITEEKKKYIREKAVSDEANARASKSGDIIKIQYDEQKGLLEEINKLKKEYDDADAERQAKLRKQQEEDAKNHLANTMDNARKARDRELDINLAEFAAGKKSKEEYEAGKLKIENDYGRKGIASEIEYQQALLGVLNLSKDERIAIEEKLYDLKKKLYDTDLKNFEEAQGKKKELEQQRNDALKGLAGDAANLANTLLTASYENQKNALQEQIDKVNELKDADIARVNASTDSAEQKAAKIKIIEAKAQSDKENLERRQKQLDIRKAQFDKLFKAFQITTSGIENVARIKMALAELTAKAVANPFLAPLIPLAAAQIPISIAVTAANLAGVLATPIPKYYTGTNWSEEGYAHVAERGPELGIDRTGKTVLYTDPTIAYLSAGTKILPADVTAQVLRSVEEQRNGLTAGNFVVNTTANKATPTDEEILAQLKQLNKKSKIVIINQSGIESTPWYNTQMKH